MSWTTEDNVWTYRNFTDKVRYYKIYPKADHFLETDTVFRYIIVPTDMKDSIVSLVRASEKTDLGIEGGDELRGDPDINSDGSVDLYDAAAMKNLLRGCSTLTEPLRDIESEVAKTLTRMYFKANLNGDIWFTVEDRFLWPKVKPMYGFNVSIDRRGMPYEPDGYVTDSDGGGSPDHSYQQHDFEAYEFTRCYPKEDSYDTALWTFLGLTTDPEGTEPEFRVGEKVVIPNGFEPEFCHRQPNKVKQKNTLKLYRVFRNNCTHEIQYTVKRESGSDNFTHSGSCACRQFTDTGRCIYSAKDNQCPVCKTRYYYTWLKGYANDGTRRVATLNSLIQADSSRMILADINKAQLGSETLERDGYTLLGWSEDPDATEPQYAINGYVTVSAETPEQYSVGKTIYAVWQKDPEPCDHTVNYQVKHGSTWTEFVHYGTCECGEVSDEGICTYSSSNNVCPVCKTRFNYIYVTYRANGGTLNTSVLSNIFTNTDTHVFDLANSRPPVRDGYTLLGWSEDENAVTPTWSVTDSVTVTVDNPSNYYVGKVLYAVWQKDQASCGHENVSYAPTGSDPNKLSQHASTCVDCGQVVGDPADCVFETVSEYVDRCSICGNEKIKYSLTVDFNGGTGLLIDLPPDVSPDGTASVGNKSQSNILTVRSYVMMIDLSALKDSTIIKDGYTLLGFADSADATEAKYQVGDKFELTADVPARTVYAVWKSDECQHEHVQWSNVSSSGKEWSKLKHFFICNDCGYTSPYEDCDFKHAFETNPETCTVCGNKLYQYQVKFDYNLPSGESIDGALGVTLTLPATEGPFFTLDTSDPFFDTPTSSLMPERPGYTLLGWQEGPAADDETVDFPAGSEILLHVDDRQREFRAVWQKTCDHKNTSYVPTGDDPHNLDKHVLTCQDCGQAVGEAEACVFEPDGECFRCSVCNNLRTEFVLTLDLNGGTGMLADGTAVVSQYDYTYTTTDRSHEFMIDMSVFQDGVIRKDGYVFAGWKTFWSASEVEYSNGDTVVLAIDDLPVDVYYPGPYLDLFAVWKDSGVGDLGTGEPDDLDQIALRVKASQDWYAGRNQTA